MKNLGEKKREIVVVTSNSGKFLEISKELEKINIKAVQEEISYPEIQADDLKEVVNFGLDYLMDKIDKPFIIDDSGLFIDALNGFPGVYSHYIYSTLGKHKLLELLCGFEHRPAHFKTVIGYVDENREKHFFEGICKGKIGNISKGKMGFGFDPIFFPEGHERTFAQMSPTEKNAISHRGKAIKKFIEHLKKEKKEQKSLGNIAVLASGSGTDFQSIVDAVESGYIPGKVALLICNNKDAYVLERAKRHNIKAVYIDHRGKTREEFEREMAKEIDKHHIKLIVLAGFMRMLTPYFVNKYKGRLINIHPALLPSFPGTRAHRDALAYGVKVSGCTIHFVDEEMDHGPIIFQKAVEVKEEDTENTLRQRVLKEEHKYLPMVVKYFLEGRIRVEGRKVYINREGVKDPP